MGPISRRDLHLFGFQLAGLFLLGCKQRKAKGALRSDIAPAPRPKLPPYVIDEFKGITLDGQLVPDLFLPTENSQLDTTAILRAVNLYLMELAKYPEKNLLQRNLWRPFRVCLLP